MTDCTDYDSPWKEALEHYFTEFMALYFPVVHQGIDWEKGYHFLDKELQQIVRDAETGRRLVDKLVQVWRKDGSEAWVLIHIEVQGQVDSEFAKRMYIYHYRLYDRYDRPVVSLAVLGDEQKNWRPNHFGYDLWGCKMRLEFPIIKLLDYQNQWERLELSNNPFAVLTMAHLKTQQTAHDTIGRLQWKVQIVKGLYRKGFAREDILELFRFIDWLMVLPEALENQFEATLQQFEQEEKMPYITHIERKGIQQGMQQGIQQGEVFILKRLLKRRFGELPVQLEQRLNEASIGELESWAEHILSANTLEDVFQ
jgi:hypothetical protein